MGCVQEFTDGRCQVVPTCADGASEASGGKQVAPPRHGKSVNARVVGPGWERETFKGVYPWAVEGDPNGHDHIAHCDTCTSLAVWWRLVWSRALVLTNSFSSNEKRTVVCRLACAYHRVNRCGGDRSPAGGINVSRAARHLGAVVRGKIQLLTAERAAPSGDPSLPLPSTMTR